MSFTLNKLTEGIRDRHVGQQNKRLVEKWSRTGLLRGMEEVNRENMATLLENQAAQVLREANTMGGDTAGNGVGGFTNIAFPIVRRVFGGLIANELVSIQPMSLPSGLLFYLDYTYGNAQGPYEKGDSIYGGPTGKAIQGGADATGGQYDLIGSGFSKTYSTKTDLVLADEANSVTHAFTVDATGAVQVGSHGAKLTGSARSDLTDKLLQFDQVMLDHIDSLGTPAAGSGVAFVLIPLSAANFAGNVSLEHIKQISLTGASTDALNSTFLTTQNLQTGTAALNIRRLNRLVKVTGVSDSDADLTATNIAAFEDVPTASPGDTDVALLAVVSIANANIDKAKLKDELDMDFVVADQVEFSGGEADGNPSFESDFNGDASGRMGGDGVSPVIPEIDIKIESIPVTAQTRKLRARWSPELAQDLNAYHSMDAEVELTQILSEQIALEIDREILGDLLNGAQGANFFWSRSPGKFVNKRTGTEIARTSTLTPGPAFTGTVREWYETLTETIIDVANEIHRKTLRGSANFIVVSPDVATILEASVLYRPSYSLDGDGQVGTPFTMGAEKVGTLSNRFTVYKDPYFPRNKVLVGYKGGSYLETGFVYAPYVPLIVTPTIFQPEDFTPRKGVMTRYGKKMVRADFYGTVTCLDMNVI